jgi:hypothetical protein
MAWLCAPEEGVAATNEGEGAVNAGKGHSLLVCMETSIGM